tara:strand:+ start:7667 stop:10294 length:2628 start_codon:yes stop_codon:yes gene_type:complete
MATPQEIQNQKNLNKEKEVSLSLEQELLQILQRRVGVEKDVVNEQQDIRNILVDQTNQMKFQSEEKRLIRQISGQISRISEQTYSINKKELGLTKTTASITKMQLDLDKGIQLLATQKNKLLAEGGQLNVDIANSIQQQVDESIKLKKELSKVAISSEKISNNFGTKAFSGLADVTKSIPGLRSFSTPFENAAEAAREQAQFNLENFGTTKKLSKESLKSLKTGKGLNNKDNGIIKSLKLEGKLLDKNGKLLTGTAAAARLKTLGLTKSISPLKAGFKSLGPVISKALGPLALIKAAIDIGKFFFDAMVGASKATAEFSRNLLISRESARELYTTTIPGIVGEFNQIAKEQGNVTITAEAYSAALSSINSELGMQLNLAKEFGKETAMNVAEVAKMQQNFGLSASAATQLFLESERTNVPLDEMNKSIFGTLGLMSAQSGLQVDLNKVIEEAASISGNMRANFRGNTEAIAQAVFQAKLLGLSLSQMEGVSGSLLDFQSSIESEMAAELLTGRQLNLEEARRAALMGDTETLMSEISKQAGTQEDFLAMNIIQRQALAKAVGLEANELADMFKKQSEQDALAKKNLEIQNKLRKEGKSLLAEGFNIKEASLAEIRIAAQKAGKSEAELRDILGDQIYLRKQEEDATQKFNKALAQAKEAFARLVGGGVLDKLVAGLTGLVESSLFKGFIEEGEAENLSNIAQDKDNKFNLSDEEKEILKSSETQITGVEKTATVAGSAAAGAAAGAVIGSIVPGIGTAAGAVIGGAWGAISSALATGIVDNIQKENLEEARTIAREKGIDGYEKVDDFILRPGQSPIKFNKDDLLIGGTNLGGSNDGEVVTLLKELISEVRKGGDVYIDGAKAGRSLALSTSRIG